MKHIGKLIICAVLSAFAASAATVGFEDIFGLAGSDRDFNDIQIITSGLTFHLMGTYVLSPLPGYSEIPLPDGYFFDYAILDTGGGMITFDSIQSSASNLTAMVRIGFGIWRDVPTAGSLLLSGAPGTTVAFGMHRDGATFYSDPAANGDGLYHAAVTGIPTDSTPEPGTLALIGLGLVWIARRRLR